MTITKPPAVLRRLDPHEHLSDHELLVVSSPARGGGPEVHARGDLRRALYARGLGWCPDCARAGEVAVHPQANMQAPSRVVRYSVYCQRHLNARGRKKKHEHSHRHSLVSAAEIRRRLAARTFSCSRCGEERRAEDFAIDRSQLLGIKQLCRECNCALALTHNRLHPEQGRAVQARRNALKAANAAGMTDAERSAILDVYDSAELSSALREDTGLSPVHVDHIIPLACGGSHAADNLQLLPAEINCAKRALNHDDALMRVAGYADWASGKPYFEQVTYRTFRTRLATAA